MICDAVNERGVCRLALSGGTTPHPMYKHLAIDVASEPVPWDCVEVFFGDERDVPHDHVESNYNMAQRTLLDHLPVDPARVHPMPADRKDLSAGAEEYEQTIRLRVPVGSGGIPHFDLILLGVGSDGHVASLFPHTPALKENRRLVIAYHVSVLGRERMSFTFPLINAARNVIMMVTGEDKAEVIADILDTEGEHHERLPAFNVHPQEGKLHIVLDRSAATKANLQPTSST